MERLLEPIINKIPQDPVVYWDCVEKAVEEVCKNPKTDFKKEIETNLLNWVKINTLALPTNLKGISMFNTRRFTLSAISFAYDRLVSEKTAKKAVEKYLTDENCKRITADQRTKYNIVAGIIIDMLNDITLLTELQKDIIQQVFETILENKVETIPVRNARAGGARMRKTRKQKRKQTRKHK